MAQGSCLVLEAFSVSHGKASAYLPIIELLKDYFALSLKTTNGGRREKIGGKVLMLDRTLEDTLPYVFALLGVEERGELWADSPRTCGGGARWTPSSGFCCARASTSR